MPGQQQDDPAVYLSIEQLLQMAGADLEAEVKAAADATAEVWSQVSGLRQLLAALRRRDASRLRQSPQQAVDLQAVLSTIGAALQGVSPQLAQEAAATEADCARLRGELRRELAAENAWTTERKPEDWLAPREFEKWDVFGFEMADLRHRRGGWDDEAHFRFLYIKQQFQGRGRELFAERLRLEFPHLTREQLHQHEATCDGLKFAGQRQAAAFRQWRRERLTLLRRHQQRFAERRRASELLALKKQEMMELRAKGKVLQGRLEVDRAKASAKREAWPEFAVPQKVYLKWLRQQMDVERACMELPFTIALLCVFGAFAIIGLSQDRIYRVQHAIHEDGGDIAANANFAFSRYQGHKNFEDVHGIEDFWSWLRLGYLPLVVQPVWSYSEGRDIAVASVFDLLNAFGSGSQPLPISGDYLRYNRMVGGFRLRQGVSSGSSASCRFPGAGQRSAWERWYGKSCKPNYQEVIYSPEPADAQTFHDPVRVEWFLPEMDTLDQIYSKVLDMQDPCMQTGLPALCTVLDGCSQMAAKNRSECLCNSCQLSSPAMPWLQEDTKRVEVGMVTYNANEGIVTHTGVNFLFTRGGRVLKRIETLGLAERLGPESTMSIWVDASRPDVSNLWTMVFGIIWTLLLLHIFCTEVKEIAIILINADTGVSYEVATFLALFPEYVGFSNTVDWISLIVATVVAVFFVLLSYQSTELQVAMNVILQSKASADREDQGFRA
eukprot:s1942_g1.t1